MKEHTGRGDINIAKLVCAQRHVCPKVVTSQYLDAKKKQIWSVQFIVRLGERKRISDTTSSLTDSNQLAPNFNSISDFV